MTDPEAQLQVLETAIGELEGYLLSPEVFWRMSGPAGLPSLTLGGIELARRALLANTPGLRPEARQRTEQALAQLDRLHGQHRAAWARKAAAELKARVNQWKAYLQDLAESARESDAYAQEVRNRAMATYLLEQAAAEPGIAEARKTLEMLDGRLRASFQPGKFIWEPRLETTYPPGPFWFLYGRPRNQDPSAGRGGGGGSFGRRR